MLNLFHSDNAVVQLYAARVSIVFIFVNFVRCPSQITLMCNDIPIF